MVRLIVGLGNPGQEYEKTRHNAGVWFVERLCNEYQLTLHHKSSLYGQYTHFNLTESIDLHLFCPSVFMNHSGRAVRAVLNYYKIPPEEMLVVHDELDFESGIARLKLGGGTGGHNGLNDIVKVCKSNYFWRLRIGIGHPQDKYKVPRYVLSAPQKIERVSIDQAIQQASSVLEDLCLGQTERAIQCLHAPRDGSCGGLK